MLMCDCPVCPSLLSPPPPVLADLRQAGLITRDECRELSSIGRVVTVQRTKSPEVMTKTAAVLRRHELGEEFSLLSGKLLSLLAAA